MLQNTWELQVIRVAILGAGNIVQNRHLPAWKTQSDATVESIVDTRAELAKQVSHEYGIPKWTTDYREVLLDDSIDTVDLCLPHHLHASIGRECLEAGKHLLIEKPIALDLESARKLIKTAETNGRLLMVAENWRYAAVTVEALQVLRSGEIGSPLLLKAAMEFNFQPRQSNDQNWRLQHQNAGGGVLLDSGIHTISVSRLFMGEIMEVSAFRGRQTWPELAPSEDTLAMIARFDNESVGVLDFTWRGHRFEACWAFEVLGSEGTLSFDVFSGRLTVERQGDRVERLQSKSSGFPEEIRYFLDCLQDDTLPRTTGLEEARTLAAVLAAYRSVESGSAETVETV